MAEDKHKSALIGELENERKRSLIAELEKARSRLATNVGALRGDLDVRAQATSAYARNPAVWIGAAVLLGLVVAKLPARTKKVVVNARGKERTIASAGKAGLALGALKLALDLAKPAITAWVKQRVAGYMDAGRKNGRSAK